MLTRSSDLFITFRVDGARSVVLDICMHVTEPSAAVGCFGCVSFLAILLHSAVVSKYVVRNVLTNIFNRNFGFLSAQQYFVILLLLETK